MIEILASLQLLNGGGLLIVMSMVAWLVAQQRKHGTPAQRNGADMEAFAHELTMTADAIIERYEQQRLRLEDTAQRVERLVAGLGTIDPAHQPLAAAAHGRRRKSEEAAAREVAVVATNGARRAEPQIAASGELELIRKMQKLRGGDSK